MAKTIPKTIRMKPEDIESIEAYAELAGLTFSRYIMQTLLGADKPRDHGAEIDDLRDRIETLEAHT